MSTLCAISANPKQGYIFVKFKLSSLSFLSRFPIIQFKSIITWKDAAIRKKSADSDAEITSAS